MNEASDLNPQVTARQQNKEKNWRKDLASFDLASISRHEYQFLVAFTIVALALRFFKLGQWSLWIDEIYTINRAQAHYSDLQLALQNIPPHTNWVPVSLLAISAVINTLGISEWSARLVPAVIGVLSIPILYFPTRKVFGTGVALISALLLAVSPWHVSWSQNARFYTAIMLLYTLALFAVHFGLESDRPRYLVLGLVLFYLAMSERIFALFMVPVLAIYLVLLWLLPIDKPRGFNWRNVLILASPIIAGLLIEAASFALTGSFRFFGDFGWFFLYRNTNPFRLSGVLAFDFGFVLLTFALFGSLFLLDRKTRPGLLVTLSAFIPPVILALLSLFMFTQDRYVFAALPSWLILAAVIVKAIWSRLRNYRTLLAIAVLSALLAEAAGAHLLYFRVNEGNRRDWRSAFALVQEHARDDDAVVAFWPEFGPYYLDREIIAWDDFELQAVVKSDHRTWFVIDSETVWGDLQKKWWIEQNAKLVDVFYLRTPEENSIRVYLFDPDFNLDL